MFFISCREFFPFALQSYKLFCIPPFPIPTFRVSFQKKYPKIRFVSKKIPYLYGVLSKVNSLLFDISHKKQHLHHVCTLSCDILFTRLRIHTSVRQKQLEHFACRVTAKDNTYLPFCPLLFITRQASPLSKNRSRTFGEEH